MIITRGCMSKIGFISLGCPKNQVDSEIMLGILGRAGFMITSDLSAADIIIINTCSFIEAAKRESLETILDTARLKSAGTLKKLIIAGCLPQRYMTQLQREIPEVDAFVSIDDIERINEICHGKERYFSTITGFGPRYLYSEGSPRILTGKSFSAYVKIADGCDNPCSFCAIPAIRGNYRSRHLLSIIAEVHGLAERGVKEINLVAQDTTAYGSDFGRKDHLADLLEALCTVDGIMWMRIMYGYPSRITDRLIEVIASSRRICRYLDIPFQHASAKILRSMKRGGNRSAHMALIEKLRSSIPGIALRTSIIVGYPGETKRDFDELLSFCREAEFEHLGAFRYSHEEGTGAFDLKDSVPENLKEERERLLMEMQQDILKRKQKTYVGKEYEVLCEGTCEESEHLLTGRLETQAPDIDGRIIIKEGTARIGDFVKVRITESQPYDLIGSIVDYIP